MTTIDYIFNNLPSRVYTKEESSNLYKFLSSFAVEMDEITNAMIELRKTKFIDTAMGNDLDKLGALLNLKRFSTENDEGFRARVKTRVQTFIGGGTVEALKQIIRLALNVEPTVIEHYQANRNHLVFNDGVFKDCNVLMNTGLTVKVDVGLYYIQGTPFKINTQLTPNALTANTKNYIIAKADGTVVSRVTAPVTNEILLAEVQTNATAVTSITDKRYILNPFRDAITNTASVTIQIPYDFVEGNITLENVKDILKSTKAAGIALLIKLIETQEDTVNITEQVDFTFEMGFSGLGGENYIGGR